MSKSKRSVKFQAHPASGSTAARLSQRDMLREKCLELLECVGVESHVSDHFIAAANRGADLLHALAACLTHRLDYCPSGGLCRKFCMRHVGNRQKVRRKHVSGLSALQAAFRGNEQDFAGSHPLFSEIMKQGSAFSVTAALKVYRDRRSPAPVAQPVGSQRPASEPRRKPSYADAAATPPHAGPVRGQQPAKAPQVVPPLQSKPLNMDLDQMLVLFKQFLVAQAAASL